MALVDQGAMITVNTSLVVETDAFNANPRVARILASPGVDCAGVYSPRADGPTRVTVG